MERLYPLIRISLGLVALTISILLGLDVIGWVGTPKSPKVAARTMTCEVLANQVAAAAARDDLATARSALRSAVRRDEEVLSAGLRGADKRLILSQGDHRRLWQPELASGSDAEHTRVPLFRQGKPWATLEVRFAPLYGGGVLGGLWSRPLVKLVVGLGVLGFFAYLFYMRRMLRHLDPSAVIPTRVQTALNVMAEGVLLVDQNERIVLANTAFAEKVDRPRGLLRGVQASSLGWRRGAHAGRDWMYPWVEAMRSNENMTGVEMQLEDNGQGTRIFTVNSSPILDGWHRAKGAIVTFDDITELEQKSQELARAMGELEKSQEEIRLHNEELQILARTDPLTGIANRRAFMERLDAAFEASQSRRGQLACVMADVDHFKVVNDSHGHAVGDEVLRRLGEAFSGAVGAESVCRYGGEEFCLMLDDTTIERAKELAEELRRRIAQPGFARVPITVSFGVAERSQGARTSAELLDRADIALYASKERGRDCVTCFSVEALSS